jgi:hypothetical protein
MSIIQQAIETLANAEATLKRLIGEAAECAEYSSVAKLARWASSIGALCSEEHATKKISLTKLSDAQEGQTSSANVFKSKTPSKTSRHSKRHSYPLFAKSGDVLVKIAWSKSSKSEYKQKSPQTVIKILAESLAHHAKSNAVVSMDNILPLKIDDESEIPNYQVYISLAWLRQIGAVKQNGRQGYTVGMLDGLIQKIDAAWQDLPETVG